MADLKRNGGTKPSTSGINGIDVFLADSSVNSWVFDTGSVAHICNSMQSLTKNRRVARGEMDLRVGNKEKVAALAVGTLPLLLPSGFIMELNNCYCVPAMSRNIISTSCLMAEGYEFIIKNNGCSIFLNEMLYGYAPVLNGLYILNLDDAPIYNINAKRLRPNNLNSTFICIVVWVT